MRRGSRPCQPADQRYDSAYLFGAICPARGTGAGLALPYADTEAKRLHLDKISRMVARGAHAGLLLDLAGLHTTVENVWQHLRQTWPSNRVFDTYEAIIEAACEAWNWLTDQPQAKVISEVNRINVVPRLAYRVDGHIHVISFFMTSMMI